MTNRIDAGWWLRPDASQTRVESPSTQVVRVYAPEETITWGLPRGEGSAQNVDPTTITRERAR